MDHILVLCIEQCAVLRANSPDWALRQDKVFLRFILVWADRVQPRRRLSVDLVAEIGRRISGLGKLEAAFNVVGAGPERIN